MSGPPEVGSTRARSELAAARLLAVNGFGPQAISRAYFAAFYAAEAALAHIGETRSKHSGVVAAAAQVLVRRHGVDERAGRLLRSLFDRRSQADYGLAAVSDEEAQRAVEDAEAVVDLLDRWLRTER